MHTVEGNKAIIWEISLGNKTVKSKGNLVTYLKNSQSTTALISLGYWDVWIPDTLP